MWSSVRIDGPIGAAVLESHPDVIGRLENLKRKRHIHDARHPEQISFRIRIGGRTVLEILPLLWERLRPVRKLVALDHALSCRHAEPS